MPLQFSEETVPMVCTSNMKEHARNTGVEVMENKSGEDDQYIHLEEEDEGGLLACRRRKETFYSEDLSNYGAPPKELTQQERLKMHLDYFNVPLSKLQSLMKDFKEELQRGLEAHRAHPFEWKEEESCFKMVDSYADKLPTGNETGVFYGVDFGGTNLRSVRVVLKGNGKVERSQAKFSLKYEGPSGRGKGLLDGSATATQLFDHFAIRMRRILENVEEQEQKSDVPVGFTFSFPCVQRSLKNAELVEWTKGFETGRETNDPVEGQDVGRLLTEAFGRNDVRANLIAVLNDTVGTLISCAYQKPADAPDCLIGVILGTGSNGCYVDPRAQEYGYKGKVINIEFGNFNRNLPQTEMDLEIDWRACNRGHQLFEKLISGAYLGELIRGTVIRVFQCRTPSMTWTMESFSAEDAGQIMNDETEDMSISRQVLDKRWGPCDALSLSDVKEIQQICWAVFDRSASLAAVAISAIALQTGKLETGLTCGVDGSLYVKNARYRDRVQSCVHDLLGEQEEAKLKIFPADDGSGKGAAILAATYSS